MIETKKYKYVLMAWFGISERLLIDEIHLLLLLK